MVERGDWPDPPSVALWHVHHQFGATPGADDDLVTLPGVPGKPASVLGYLSLEFFVFLLHSPTLLPPVPHSKNDTLSILLGGRFRVRVQGYEGVVLIREGDYVIFARGQNHGWIAEEDSIVLTIAWPSDSDPLEAQ